jgi:hypothetical protein
MRRGLASILGAATAVVWPSLLPAHGQDLSFRDFPSVIYCEYQGIAHAFYFSRLDRDGVAIYLTPDRQAGTITIDGVARRVGGGEHAGTCSDKTLDELRSSGQAFDLPG